MELKTSDLSSSSNEVILQETLRDAYSNGIKLIYLFTPAKLVPFTLDENKVIERFPLPGILVDEKTTYEMTLENLDISQLYSQIYNNDDDIIIRLESKAPANTSNTLKDLAISSGEWSRFRVDTNIPTKIYDDIFTGWINNSVNRSLADDVFVAFNKSTNEDVGFITVKKKEANHVNIGLLAVSSNYRRKGIAKKLLSRASVWALENTFWNKSTKISVITQGANKVACCCYEKFGFTKVTIQDVYHVWLPQHMIEPLSRSDKAKLPFCKQHLTGSEITYINQVLSSGLDSAARFTTMCATKLKEILGDDCERVVMVPSGTAALEMASLLIELQQGDEVIMPSYTFSSTANAVVLRGAVPVFVDIKAETLNIDENLIEQAVTSKTKAICCVHYAGVPCEMDPIMDIAKRHNLFVIEDAAQGFQTNSIYDS